MVSWAALLSRNGRANRGIDSDERGEVATLRLQQNVVQGLRSCGIDLDGGMRPVSRIAQKSDVDNRG